MILTKVVPEVDYTEDAEYDVFKIATGGEVVFNPFDHTNDDGVGAHSGWEREVVPGVVAPIRMHPAMVVERQFFRRDLSNLPTIPNNEKDDQAPSSHQTGDGRRYYIEVVLEWVLMGDQRGFDAIRSWNREQLLRPMSHRPWSPKCDAYSCLLDTGFKYDTSINGYDAFDPAHLSSAMQYAGCLAKDPLGLINLFMLAKFDYLTTPPGKKFWLNQPRARAWKLILWTHCHLAGMSSMDDKLRDQFFGGKTPRVLLERYWRQLLDYWKADGDHSWGSNNLDSRVMPILNGGQPHAATGLAEIEPGYGWQAWVELWGCIYSRKSGVIRDAALIAEIDAALIDRCRKLMDRVAGMSGSSYAQSCRTYDDVQLAAILPEAQLADPTIEAVQLPDSRWVMRTIPRRDDLWLAAGAVHILGVDEVRQRAPQWEALLPKPGSTPYYTNSSSSKASYLEPFWRAYEDRDASTGP